MHSLTLVKQTIVGCIEGFFQHFNKIRIAIFWKQIFQDRWGREFSYDSKYHLYFGADELKKQKYLWQMEKGQRWGLSPDAAIFEAFKEISDKLYRNVKPDEITTERQHEMFEDIAYQLYNLSMFIDINNTYQEKPLGSPWDDFYKEYKQKREIERSQKVADNKEIESFHFKKLEIDQAWERLLSSDIPEEAKRIWFASYPRKAGHEIADTANVSIKEFVFWVCVFREYLYYQEDIVCNTHMYYRNGDYKKLEDAINHIKKK